MAYIPFMKPVLSIPVYPDKKWLAVERRLLDELGIADKITWYSRQRGSIVYLLAGCDQDIFGGALDSRGIKVEWTAAVQDGTPNPEDCERYSFYNGSRKV